jgi:L-histidine Nalpha-methyltransferase / hercynylcysteine S-oxide synthase
VHCFQAKGRPITNEEVLIRREIAMYGVIANFPQYALYLEATGSVKLPASWAKVDSYSTDSDTISRGYENEPSASIMNGSLSAGTNGLNGCQNGYGGNPKLLSEEYLDNAAVRTVYGPVPLKHALHWPVFASYDELSACAHWMGGRIPTTEEARSIYSHADSLKPKEAEQHLGKTVPAVNGFLT